MKALKYLVLICCFLGLVLAADTALKDSTNVKDLKDQKLLLDALKNFVDDKPQAADEIEYIIQSKEEAARNNMNNLLEKMAVDAKPTDNMVLEGGTLDFITKKLNLALVYFYEAKYWLTIEECTNVLNVDPKNTLAWIRRGSGYFMLGKYPEAQNNWKIALALQPKKDERKDIEKFMAKINEINSQNN
jgi:tetratricopeptide (TPR) repeat protein